MVKRYEELTIADDLFLCTFDPFGLGYAKNIPEHLKKLYDYIRTGKVGDDLTRRIDEAVIKARKNEVWRSEYMKELLHDDDIREEGSTAGRP